MKDMTIKGFCRKFAVCKEGRDWALLTGCTTMAALWRRKDMPFDWRLWIITQDGVTADRDLRLFACRCVRDVWHLLTDERSRDAVRVAERYARGNATGEELDAARDAAQAAVRAAAQAAGRAAAQDAAWVAAQDAARAATEYAAWDAARDAAQAAVRAAAWDATQDAAQDAARAATQAKQARRVMCVWPQPFARAAK